MSREFRVHGYILKKQDFAEADQIVTIFSRESGKLRAIVKSAKLPTSKLQSALQPLFLSQLTLTKISGLGKVITAQVIDPATGVYQDAKKLEAWFVVAEMLLRALPDEEPNDLLFNVLQRLIKFLADHELSEAQIMIATLQFQLQTLTALGLGMQLPKINNEPEKLFLFEPARGGFVTDSENSNASLINVATARCLLELGQPEFRLISCEDEVWREAKGVINRFVTYQLDRELKSTKF